MRDAVLLNAAAVLHLRSTNPPTRLRTRAMPLYLTALWYGVTSAVFWLYAVQAVANATRTGPATPALLWTRSHAREFTRAGV